jgi:hypothetical protein
MDPIDFVTHKVARCVRALLERAAPGAAHQKDWPGWFRFMLLIVIMSYF